MNTVSSFDQEHIFPSILENKQASLKRSDSSATAFSTVTQHNCKIMFCSAMLRIILNVMAPSEPSNVMRVPGRGPEHRESEQTVLYPQIIIILISYYYILLLNY